MGIAGLKPMFALNRSTASRLNASATNTAACRGRTRRRRSATSTSAAPAKGIHCSSELMRTTLPTEASWVSKGFTGGGSAKPQATSSAFLSPSVVSVPAPIIQTNGTRKISVAAPSTSVRRRPSTARPLRSSSPQPASSASPNSA